MMIKNPISIPGDCRLEGWLIGLGIILTEIHAEIGHIFNGEDAVAVEDFRQPR